MWYILDLPPHPITVYKWRFIGIPHCKKTYLHPPSCWMKCPTSKVLQYEAWDQNLGIFLGWFKKLTNWGSVARLERFVPYTIRHRCYQWCGGCQGNMPLLGGGSSIIFLNISLNFHPANTWRNDPIWRSHIFQLGWNHQLVKNLLKDCSGVTDVVDFFWEIVGWKVEVCILKNFSSYVASRLQTVVQNPKLNLEPFLVSGLAIANKQIEEDIFGIHMVSDTPVIEFSLVRTYSFWFTTWMIWTLIDIFGIDRWCTSTPLCAKDRLILIGHSAGGCLALWAAHQLATTATRMPVVLAAAPVADLVKAYEMKVSDEGGGKGVWRWFRLEKTRDEDIIEASKNYVTAMNTWNAESFTYPWQFWLGTPHGTMDDLRWCGGTLYEANADHRSVIGGVSESFPRSFASWPTEKRESFINKMLFLLGNRIWRSAQ